MINDFAFSRIFLVSESSEIFQKLSSQFPPNAELTVFKDWRACFQKMFQQPEVIFYEWNSDSRSGQEFIDKMITFNEKVPIVIIKNSNNKTEVDYLKKPNVFNHLISTNIEYSTLQFLLKNIFQNIQLQNQVQQLQTQLELKSAIDKSMNSSEVPSINNPFLDQDLTFEGFKSQIIHHYLKKFDDDIMMVANKLDIGKSTIYRMLKTEKERKSKDMSWFN